MTTTAAVELDTADMGIKNAALSVKLSRRREGQIASRNKNILQ